MLTKSQAENPPLTIAYDIAPTQDNIDDPYRTPTLPSKREVDLDSERIYDLLVSLEATTKTEAQKTRFHLSQQITRTKADLTDIIQKQNLTIIDCIRLNSVNNIKIMSLFSFFLTLFFLLVSIILRIEIINPFFGTLLLIASAGFYVMTKIEQRTRKAT